MHWLRVLAVLIPIAAPACAETITPTNHPTLKWVELGGGNLMYAEKGPSDLAPISFQCYPENRTVYAAVHVLGDRSKLFRGQGADLEIVSANHHGKLDVSIQMDEFKSNIHYGTAIGYSHPLLQALRNNETVTIKEPNGTIVLPGAGVGKLMHELGCFGN